MILGFQIRSECTSGFQVRDKWIDFFFKKAENDILLLFSVRDDKVIEDEESDKENEVTDEGSLR